MNFNHVVNTSYSFHTYHLNNYSCLLNRTGQLALMQSARAIEQSGEHMIELRDIYYTRLGTQDLKGAEKFATQILGLQLVEKSSERLYLKGDNKHHSLCYFLGDPSDHTVAFELRDWTAITSAHEQLKNAGIACGLGTDAEAHDRHVESFMWFLDPTGNRIELVSRPHDAGWRYFPSRDAGITGFGHVGLCSTDPVRDQSFWLTHFNAMVSDWIGPCHYFE